MCLTLCSSMVCSPSGSSIHEILQARILAWVAIPFSMDLPHTGIEPGSPTLQADSLPYGKPITVFKWQGFFLLLSAYFQISSQKAFRTDFRGLISYSFPHLTVRYSEETLPTVWQGPLTSGFFFLLENFDFYSGQQIPSIAFLFKKNFYYWSILALQCCVSFCFTTVWIS